SSPRTIAACAIATASFRPTTSRRAAFGAMTAVMTSFARAKTGATPIAARIEAMADVEGRPLPAPPRPWGYVATLAWALLVGVLSIVCSVGTLALWNGSRLEAPPDLLTDGPLLANVTLISTIVE